MGDIQISGAAVTVLGAMFVALSSAVVYLFKTSRSDSAQMRTDFQQTIKDLRTDYQARLDECRQENGRLTAYIDRQAGTVKESTELLKDISARIPTTGRS